MNTSRRFALSVMVAALAAAGCRPSAPPPPELSGTTPASPSNNTTVTVQGTAKPGTLIRVFASEDCSGTELGQASSDASGAFSVDATVEANATTALSATAEEKGGPASGCSAALSFVHDGVPPAPPVVSSTEPASPSNVGTPELAGTAEPGARVRVYGAAGCAGAVLGEGDAHATTGAFRVRVQVPANAATVLRATATDRAGNTSACSDTSVPFEHDNVAPAAPVLMTISPISPGNGTSPTVTGTTEAGTHVFLYGSARCSGTPLGELQLPATSGSFSIVATVPANTRTLIYAAARDAAGNVSCSASGLEYIEDSIAPPAPTLSGVSPTSPSSTVTLTLTGTGEPGSLITLTGEPDCAGPLLGAMEVPVGGAFTLLTDVAANSTTRIYLRAFDAAGNASGCVDTMATYIHDDIPPSETAATIEDGAGADVDFQNTLAAITAHWTGFTDATGITGYEYNVSSSTACDGDLVATANVGLSTSGSSGAATLTERTYFGCVRAVDGAGNRSPWVASDGVTVDVTAPAVVDLLPRSGEPNVAVKRPIILRVSEPLDPDTANASHIRLLLAGVPVPATLTVSGLMLTLQPNQPLQLAKDYEVEITAGVADAAGNALAPQRYPFTSSDRAWSPLRAVATGAITQVALASNSAGEAFAAWIDRGFEVWVARNISGSWQAPILVSNQAKPSPAPRVALDDSGNGIVLWVDAGTPDVLQAAQLDVGNNLSAPTGLAALTGSLSEVDVKALPGAGVLMMWSQGGIWAARWEPTSGWGTPGRLDSAAPGSADHFDLAIDSTGRAVAVWAEQQIMAARYTPATGWSAAEAVESPAPERSSSPRVGLDGAGNAIILWVRSATQPTGVWASSTAPGGAWGTPARVAPIASASNAGGTVLAVPPTGDVMAAWYETVGTSLDYKWSVLGTSGWSAPQTLGTGMRSYLQLVPLSSGGFVAANLLFSPTSGYTSVATRYSPGFGWASAWETVLVGGISPFGFVPSLALTSLPSGKAMMFQALSTNGWSLPYQ